MVTVSTVRWSTCIVGVDFPRGEDGVYSAARGGTEAGSAEGDGSWGVGGGEAQQGAESGKAPRQAKGEERRNGERDGTERRE